MTSYYDDLIENYHIEDPTNKIILQIVNTIKYDNDYDSAIQIILKNNLKLVDIVTTTNRFTKQQVVKLAAKLISIKN